MNHHGCLINKARFDTLNLSRGWRLKMFGFWINEMHGCFQVRRERVFCQINIAKELM